MNENNTAVNNDLYIIKGDFILNYFTLQISRGCPEIMDVPRAMLHCSVPVSISVSKSNFVFVCY